MKTHVSIKPKTGFALLKSLVVAVILFGCSEPEIAPVKPAESSNSVAEELRESSEGRKSCRPEGPNYNLNVLLEGDRRGSFGFIKFRQFANETQLIHLYTWVHHLKPNTSYLLQRAVDTTLDGDCAAATAWLTLGKGLEPQAILTDSRGSGRVEFFRSVAAIPVGSTFDIHFQIIKESTSEVVLTSDCYEYTVR